MPVTERVVVLMSPAENAALDAKATNAGRISAGELIRRAAVMDVAEFLAWDAPAGQRW